MTTESRVSDSRVTDEMVNAALKFQYQAAYKRIFASPNAIPDPASDMRAALEAALACQGPVVPVDALQGLCAEWENMKVPLSANSYDLGEFDGYRGARRDLDALIAKANGHE